MNANQLTAYRDAATAAKERADKATPGPWGELESNNSSLVHVETQEGCKGIAQGFSVCSIPKKRLCDASFIAEARQDIPTLATAVVDLCAEVERLQDEHGNLTMLVRRLCLVCKSEKLTKHAVDYLKRKELYHGSILRIEGDA